MMKLPTTTEEIELSSGQTRRALLFPALSRETRALRSSSSGDLLSHDPIVSQLATRREPQRHCR